MGRDTENIFKTFTFRREEDNKNYDILLTKYNGHCIPKRNIIHEIARFHCRSQNSGETTEVFIRSFYDLAEFCEFGATKGEQIRDRIVISYKALSQILQMKPDLTVDTAIESVCHYEPVGSQNTVTSYQKDP